MTIPTLTNARIGVVRGSPDHAYEYSLASGRHMLEKLPTKYRPVDILIDTDGAWHIGGLPVSPVQALRQVDIVFNALHGAYTHEGGLIRVCDREGVPYTGSAHAATSLSFHKELAKNHLRQAGVRTALSLVALRDEDRDRLLQKVFNSLSGVLVVKPLRSSLGIDVRVARGHFELPALLEELFVLYESLLIEEYISGQEISIGVLENFRGEKEYVFVPLEIRAPRGGLFREMDHDAHLVPAHGLSDSLKKEIHHLARKLHNLFGARHYSQAEIIIRPNGSLYVIDFNTHPFLGKEGTYMKMLESVGARPEEFIEAVLSRV